MQRGYPERPILGVGGIIIHEDRVLLIKRGKEPGYGQWSVPGGMVKLGETLKDAVRREVLEETALEVEPVEQIEVFERVIRDSDNRIQYHYVLVDFVCRYISGEAEAADDALETRWVAPEELSEYIMTTGTADVIRKAFLKFRS
jgi:8-oxo-dGTP diphosphatase